MTNNNVDYYLSLYLNSDFPYPMYDDEQLKKDYMNLKDKNQSKISNSGLNIVRHFHPSIWRCSVKKHKSPLDAWYDPEIMYKVIENRLKYLKVDELTPQKILGGLSVSKLAPKVSIFRPSLVKYLINEYLNEFNEVFDPCAGFSGRMLGTCALGKKYIGQDINSITIRECKSVIDFFDLDAEISIKDSIYDFGTYECLFTCPPYGDKENWHQDIEILSADDWIDVCLKNYKCKKYLFVVDETIKYKDFIVENLSLKSHFVNKSEKVILISR